MADFLARTILICVEDWEKTVESTAVDIFRSSDGCEIIIHVHVLYYIPGLGSSI